MMSSQREREDDKSSTARQKPGEKGEELMTAAVTLIIAISHFGKLCACHMWCEYRYSGVYIPRGVGQTAELSRT